MSEQAPPRAFTCESHSAPQQCPVCRGACTLDLKLPLADVYLCRDCAHRFSFNVKVRAQDVYTEAYFSEHHRCWFEHPDVVLFEQIRAQLRQLGVGPEHSLLDVGCGRGLFLTHLHERGFRKLHGVDLMELKAACFEHTRVDVFAFEPAQRFDAVVSMMNIEHLDDPLTYLRRLSSWLQPKGILVINTIDDGALIYALARALDKAGYSAPARRLYDPHHVSHFSRRSLQRVCEEVGLRKLALLRKNYALETVDLPNTCTRYPMLAAISLINAAARATRREISQTLFLCDERG